MTRYPALIDGEDGAYGVTFLDLPGIVAMGAAVDEALVNAEESLQRLCGRNATRRRRRHIPKRHRVHDNAAGIGAGFRASHPTVGAPRPRQFHAR